MPGLALSDVKAILDSIAQQAVNIKAGFDGNSTGYTNNRASIIGAETSSDLSAGVDLSPAFAADVPVTMKQLFEARRTAMTKHLGGDLNAYLLAQNARVSRSLVDILQWSINPVNIFPPALLSSFFGSFTMSGSGAGAYTPGSPLDKTLYGPTWLNLKVVTQTWGTASTLTITGTKYDGTSQTKTAALTDGATVNTLVNVGTIGTLADNFATVTNITATGGASSDSVQVQGRLERTITL